MRRAATLWLLAGLLMLIATGVIGDAIFYPHPHHFSFRILSNYAAAIVLLITSIVALGTRRP